MDNSDYFISGLPAKPDKLDIPGFNQDYKRPNEFPILFRGMTMTIELANPGPLNRYKFTIRPRSDSSEPVFTKTIFPDADQKVLAVLTSEDTKELPAQVYFWDLFLIKDEGSRLVTTRAGYGSFSLQTSPGSDYL